MKFFEAVTAQNVKHGQQVCGDHFLCEKSIESTIYILCDGIGSGVYANIAAISCAARLMEHLQNGVSPRNAAAMVASSMHKARSEQFPFAAFTVANILNDGSFDVYNYEAPPPLLLRNGFANVLTPAQFTAEYETVGETAGTLEIGDSLILCSDGVTQAGMGHGRVLGIGSREVASFINRSLATGCELFSLPEKVAEFCSAVSGNRYEDDTTCALILCRPAEEVAIFTGPPSAKNKDTEAVQRFMEIPGEKIICGSTTIDIFSRELERKVDRITPPTASFASPPEYHMEGITLTTEGAIMLNQVFNILGESPDEFEDGVVERFCALLSSADVIHFFIGTAVNEAHQALIFKQMGIMARHRVVELIMAKLREMGKLVTERKY